MIILAGIVLSFFLSLLILSKSKKTVADYTLFFWLCITGIHLVISYMYFNKLWDKYPALLAAGIPLPLLQGPFLYLYTTYQTTVNKFRFKHLLHFVPVLCSYFMIADFFFLSTEDQVNVFIQKGAGYEIRTQINLYMLYASGIVYTIIALVKLIMYRRTIDFQFSNREKVSFNWLLYLIFWEMLIWLIILVSGNDQLIYSSVAIFVGWLGYFGIRQVKVFTYEFVTINRKSRIINDVTGSVKIEDEIPVIEPNAKYQKSSLQPNEAQRIHSQLVEVLNEKKLYTNPDLTLNELAEVIQVHPNHLSQVINSLEEKTFYDLINELRVKEFIKRVENNATKKYTLLAIAYDCGFNSKPSFNRNFKKYTGQTPSEYIKSIPSEIN